jgi:polyisoprenoid-binding protein YceI
VIATTFQVPDDRAKGAAAANSLHDNMNRQGNMNVSSKAMIALASAAFSIAAIPPGQLKLSPESKAWVSGSSTVKDFRCAAKTLDANIVAPSDETAGLELAKLVSSADIVIKVDQLDCGNGTMNEHMRKALNMSQHATITFRMSGYDITKGSISVKGDLTINGQTHPVELGGKVAEEEGVVRSSATKQIDMTVWGVKPPSLMLGTMKVKPIVTIGYDIAITR